MKINSFVQKIHKFRHLLAVAAIVAVTAACCAWVGYDTVRESVGLGHREIINDDYSVITDTVTEKGVVQPFTVKANTDFYGVNLNMHIYNRVCHGSVFVDLLDEGGNVLYTAVDDLTTVLDNTFKRFIFGGVNYRAEEDREYSLRIYTQYETAEDSLSLWKSETTVEGFGNITENGTETEGTLAMQYITKYVTAGMWKYFIALSVIFVFFLAGLYLLIFVKKAKVTTIFVAIALVIGFVFSIYTPIKGSPDEYVHMATSYNMSNRLLGVENSYKDGKLLVRECDLTDYTSPVFYNAFEIQEIYEGLTETADDSVEMVYTPARIHQTFSPLFWAQTVGITIARLLGLGFVPMVVMGRLANLLVYTLLMYFAVKTVPVYKTAFAVMALTPIPLQLAASFTYDTLVIALCFLFTACVLNCTYGRERVTLKDVALLCVLAGFIAPGKVVYIILTGLCLIIPVNKFKDKKSAFISYGAVLGCAVVMWLAVNFATINTTLGDMSYSDSQLQQLQQQTAAEDTVAAENADVHTEQAQQPEAQEEYVGYDMYRDIAANGDNRNSFSFGYILSHIPQTVKLVLNTIQENGVLYIQQLFGGILGEVIISPVKINWLYTIAVMAIVLLSLVHKQGEALVYRGARKWWGILLAVGVCALFCIICITWTPINYTTVFGIQGRYFYPVLPLIVLFFTNENLTVKKDIGRTLLFALAAVNVLILLDGFTIMAQSTTMVR